MIKSLSPFKYTAVLSLPLTVMISFENEGWLTYFPLMYVFGVIPLVELLVGKSTLNYSVEEEQKEKEKKVYNWLIYAMLPIQFGFLIYFCMIVNEPGLALSDQIGRIVSFGLMCGGIGINVGHELGHRAKKFEQRIAKGLLLSSLYLHFFIEHNRGHHKRVATHEDPASARLWEPVFIFWIRSIIGSYFSAWRLEAERLRKKGIPLLSYQNEMLAFQLVQAGFLMALYLAFGLEVMLSFLGAAGIGILLLETVNYIEHYGLSRSEKSNGVYERVMPWHSWNSDHLIGRWLLFELSRHSDHHFIASRKYQVLRHHEESPQLPTGYPGMMLLALVPPLWYAVMHPKVKNARKQAALV